ncbi:hypothetical protein K439DRAFT_1614209 [Ramaria rubella]|nr:hypothetical protein K439DRAFT_1614209 [Ramaria rubella]
MEDGCVKVGVHAQSPGKASFSSVRARQTAPSTMMNLTPSGACCFVAIYTLRSSGRASSISFSELQTINLKCFTVGRIGFGPIQFLQLVDLRAYQARSDVTFEHIECTLYANKRH